MSRNNSRNSAPRHRSAVQAGTRAFCGKIATASILLAFFPGQSLSAQSVRGTVLDAADRTPLEDAVVVLLNARNDTVASPARTNAAGQFVFYPRDAGDYKVGAMRVGFAPVVGKSISLADGEVAMLELALSSLPTTLGTVEIKARRSLSAAELMSTVGFDVRRARDVGQFIGRDELEKYGRAPLEDVMRTNAIRLSLEFAEDPLRMSGVVLMRSGVGFCVPEVRLDGNPVSNTRGGAVARLMTYGAQQIYGVEVYRAQQLPPPRLAGDIGTTSPRCGAIAIWTRAAHAQEAELLFTSFPGGPR